MVARSMTVPGTYFDREHRLDYAEQELIPRNISGAARQGRSTFGFGARQSDPYGGIHFTPDLERNMYSTMGHNAPMDPIRYSNYRQAKSRRNDDRNFRSSTSSVPQVLEYPAARYSDVGHLSDSVGRRPEIAAIPHVYDTKQYYNASSDLVARSMAVPGAYLDRGRGVGYSEQDFIPRNISGAARQGRPTFGFGARQPDSYGGILFTPDFERNMYSIVGQNAPMDPSRYSNYHQAKSRKAGHRNLRRFTPTLSLREGERRRYRERRRRGTPEDPVRRRSPGPRIRKWRRRNSRSRADNANGLDTNPPNRSEHAETGQQTCRAPHGLAHASDIMKEVGDQPVKDVRSEDEKDHELDNDSELESLCGDVTKSQADNMKGNVEDDSQLCGMIFGCSSATFHECMRLQLFGLPVKSKDLVMRVGPGTKLFLFNFDTKELSGIFEAVSHGRMHIQPDAFHEFGEFPAQVQVGCPERCPNLPMRKVKPVIKDNYIDQHKFTFDLKPAQVKELVELFKRAAKESARPSQGDDILYDYQLTAHLQSEDHFVRGSSRQRQPSSLHPQGRFGLSSASTAGGGASMATKSIDQDRKRAARRTRRRKKKRKVDSPQEDDCRLHCLPGDDANVAEAANNCKHGDITADENESVMVREIVEDKSRSVHQQKETIETEICNTTSGERSSRPQCQKPHGDYDGKQISEGDAMVPGTLVQAAENGQSESVEMQSREEPIVRKDDVCEPYACKLSCRYEDRERVMILQNDADCKLFDVGKNTEEVVIADATIASKLRTSGEEITDATAEDAVDYDSSTAGEEEETGTVGKEEAMMITEEPLRSSTDMSVDAAAVCELRAAHRNEDVTVSPGEQESSMTSKEEEGKLTAEMDELLAAGEEENEIITGDAVDYDDSSAAEDVDEMQALGDDAEEDNVDDAQGCNELEEEAEEDMNDGDGDRDMNDDDGEDDYEDDYDIVAEEDMEEYAMMNAEEEMNDDGEDSEKSE